MTCFFAEGTQARGCVVRLERSGGVVYQMIPRVNETAEGVVRTEFSVDCYNISVVDWEEDGSVGSVAIPTKLRRTSLMAFIMCNNDTQCELLQIYIYCTALYYIVIYIHAYFPCSLIMSLLLYADCLIQLEVHHHTHIHAHTHTCTHTHTYTHTHTHTHTHTLNLPCYPTTHMRVVMLGAL